MLKLSKNILKEIEEKFIKKIKVFFYESGCSGNKIDIKYDDFDITDLVLLSLAPNPFPLGARGEQHCEVYIEEKDVGKLDGAMITKTVKADHTGKEKVRYIYSSEKVLDRCGCGTSFGFEKKVPKIDFEKLKNMKNNFVKSAK